MPKHALPRSLFKQIVSDRTRGRSKARADRVLLEVFEQLNEDHEREFGKTLSVQAFLRHWMIEWNVASGLTRDKAETLADNPSEAERVLFEASRSTIGNRLSLAKGRRARLQTQVAIATALRAKITKH